MIQDGQGPAGRSDSHLAPINGTDDVHPKQEPTRVSEIPHLPARHETYYIESPSGGARHTHDLFRFPAKFHAPVVGWALENFGRDGAAVLDPFNGSGTVQVEAVARAMCSVGIDVDPLACFVARAKTTPLPPKELRLGLRRIEAIVRPFKRSGTELEELRGTDISDQDFERQTQDLSFPDIPNMFHWFSRYVVVDLARLFWAIGEASVDKQHEHFFRACAAAIIRRASNADPAPVSGLEVTRIQAERNAKRVIPVLDLFVAKATKALEGMQSLWDVRQKHQSAVTTKVLRGDTAKARQVLANAQVDWAFPLVVTSPPYCMAVQYSRRHKLEMYWLGLVECQVQHLELARTYIGRPRVRMSDWDGCGEFGIRDLDLTVIKIMERNPAKARALKHYFWSMSEVFAEISQIMPSRGKMICAIGDSVCCGVPVTTSRFFTELAAQQFTLENHFSYTVRNRHMQYPLRQGAGIGREHILVLART